MRYIFTILVFLTSLNSLSQTGHDILNDCEIALSFVNGEKGKSDSDFVKAGNCVGYIRGVSDFNTLIKVGGAKPFFCKPNSQNQFLTIKVVVEYLKKNTDKLDDPEFGLVINALREGYKCS